MCSAKKLFLKTSQISQENTCTKIFKNIYFEEHPQTIASEMRKTYVVTNKRY